MNDFATGRRGKLARATTLPSFRGPFKGKLNCVVWEVFGFEELAGVIFR